MLLQLARFHSFPWLILHCIYLIFFTCLSLDGHLGFFHVLAIVNSAALNIGLHVSFQIIILSGNMFRRGIARS